MIVVRFEFMPVYHPRGQFELNGLILANLQLALVGYAMVCKFAE